MRNIMKEKLLGGNAALGISIMIPSAQLVEMAGKLGFDWVLVDCEHGPMSLESVELMVMAAEASNITPIVRPPQNDPEIICRYMDMGAMGIQAPHVSTADEARDIVNAVKYYPAGKRSLAVGTRSANYGFSSSMSEYAEKANRDTLVCVQIEDKAALANIDAIAGVEGVDILFVGPSDLSQSLGYPGASNHPAVRKAMDDAFSKIIRSEKIAGTAGNVETAAERLEQGIRYYYTHLTTLLARSASGFLRLSY